MYQLWASVDIGVGGEWVGGGGMSGGNNEIHGAEWDNWQG